MFLAELDMLNATRLQAVSDLYTDFNIHKNVKGCFIMQEKKINSKVISVVAAVVVIAVFVAVYLIFGEKPVEGEKNITIAVTNRAGNTVTYEVNTDAEYLRGAMEDAEGLTFDGYNSEFGLTLTTVNGEDTDFVTAYWGTYVNGEMCNYGIDSQPVEDGDAFEIVYSLVSDFDFEG